MWVKSTPIVSTRIVSALHFLLPHISMSKCLWYIQGYGFEIFRLTRIHLKGESKSAGH